MNIKSISKKLIQKKVDDFVIIKNTTSNTQIKFVNNKIVNTTTQDIEALDLFVAKNKRIATTVIKDKSKIDETINKLMKFIDSLNQNRDYQGIAEGPFKYEKISHFYDKKVKSLNPTDLVEEGINAALENAKRASGFLESSTYKRAILTSGGAKKQEKGSTLYFTIRALINKDSTGHMTSTSRTLKQFNPEQAGKRAGEIAKMSVNPEKGKPGKYDIVFGHLPMADFINELGEAASIFSIESGFSCLDKKIGKNLGNFSLLESGNLQNGLSSTHFDDEGVPTKTKTIIDEGVLKTYLHNTSSAKRYNTKTTANAGLITPMPFNLILKGKQDNVFEVKKGLYITNIWYTRFQNSYTGDFSTIPRDGAFLIENGEITKPIKNIRISDNILNMFKNLKCLSDKQQQITSWDASIPTVTPEVLIEDVNVTKPHD